MTIIKVSGQPKMELRKQPVLVVSVQTEQGVFEDQAPLYFSNQHEAEDQEDIENKLCDLADEINAAIGENFKGVDIKDYEALEREVRRISDRTTKLATSMACFRASAAESGVPLQRHVRATYGQNCTRPMTLPMPCMHTLQGQGDVGADLGEVRYSVYLCPTGAEDPMSALLMCGQIYRRLGQNITDAYGDDHLKGGDEAQLIMPELESVDKSLRSALAMVRKAVSDEGLSKSVRLGVAVDAQSADIDVCGDLLASYEDLGHSRVKLWQQGITVYRRQCGANPAAAVFASAGNTVHVAGGSEHPNRSSKLHDMWGASTVGEMSEVFAGAEPDAPLCLRQRVTHTTSEHLEFLLTVAAAFGSQLMLTCAPSRRHYEKFNGLMRIDCDENDPETGVHNAPYAGRHFSAMKR